MRYISRMEGAHTCTSTNHPFLLLLKHLPPYYCLFAFPEPIISIKSCAFPKNGTVFHRAQSKTGFLSDSIAMAKFTGRVRRIFNLPLASDIVH